LDLEVVYGRPDLSSAHGDGIPPRPDVARPQLDEIVAEPLFIQENARFLGGGSES
jgi:hypothetical protein